MTTSRVQKAQALSCLGLECGAKKMGPMPGSRVSVGEQGRRAKDRGAGWGCGLGVNAGEVALGVATPTRLLKWVF